MDVCLRSRSLEYKPTHETLTCIFHPSYTCNLPRSGIDSTKCAQCENHEKEVSITTFFHKELLRSLNTYPDPDIWDSCSLGMKRRPIDEDVNDKGVPTWLLTQTMHNKKQKW